MKRIVALLLALLLLLSASGCGISGHDDDPIILPTEEDTPAIPKEPEKQIAEDGVYDSKEEVALYLHTYGRLPDNYITKKEAEGLGWQGGSLRSYAPGCCIGGSHFGNYEGLLPDGHQYYECDIDTMNADSRGAKRIIYSDDGLIFYTEDHYKSFELLYGEADGWS